MSVDLSDALSGPDETPVDTLALARLGCDDIGNAERFIARVGADVRQTQRLGVFVWDGAVWRLDDGEVLTRLKAQQVARLIFDEARALAAWANDNDDDDAKAHAKTLLAWARASGNAGRLAAMVELALPHLNTPLETWNAQATLFSAANCVLDLYTAKPVARPPRREDFITRQAAVGYRPDAAAPLWEAFVERILPDDDVRRFVRRALGACLVDSASDQAVVVAHGGGANGKSTLFDVVSDVLGDYSMPVSVKTFLADDRASGSAPQPDLVRLALRPRMVRASEPPPGSRLAEGIIKEVTGGEKLVARDLNTKPIEFRVTWKLFLQCNTRPSVRGGDDGIWRRILLVPFSVQIPPDERDPQLKDKLLAEREGVLNWLIDGYVDWLGCGGLAPPASVQEASQQYRSESDAVGRFITECCVRRDDAQIDIAVLYEALEAWAKAESLDPPSKMIFARRLSDRGFGASKSNGKTFRLGLDLTQEAREAAADFAFDRAHRASRRRAHEGAEAGE